MTWCATMTGAAVSLVAPQPDSIRLDDIAGQLSVMPRFNGAARVGTAERMPRVLTCRDSAPRDRLPPISIAQHCLIVRDIVRVIAPSSHAARLWALLHDAHEAYTGDITTPVQQALAVFGAGEAVKDMQGRLDLAIAWHFGIAWEHVAGARAIVKRADVLALGVEKSEAMVRCDREWHVSTEGMADGITWVEPMTAAAAALAYRRAVRLELTAYHAAFGNWAKLDTMRAAG